MAGGTSKKKEKRWAKAQARVGAKAKAKFRKSQQISARQELQASKRRAAEATGHGKGRGKGGGDDGVDFSSMKGVDALFAHMAGEDDDDSPAAGGDPEDGEDGSDADSDSSAGAFQDLDGSDDDAGELAPTRGVVEELDDEEDEGDTAKRHEEELAAIKEKDPEFYKFLVEQDKQLLQFSAPDDDDDEEDKAEAGDEDEEAGGLQGADIAGAAGAGRGRVVTKEHLERIRAAAKDSFTACKAALNIYHTAVRSIEGTKEAGDDDEDDDEGEDGKKAKKKKKRKSAAALKKAKQRLFTIADESIFSDVIEWSVANLLDIFKHYAGEPRATKASASAEKGKKRGKRRRQQEESAVLPTDAGEGMYDPSTCERWSRVRVLASIFWEETYFLLNHLVANEMLEFVLRNISTPEALCWLWPFKIIRSKYVKRSTRVWSMAPTHNVRLLSFLFLRNCAAMVMHAPEGNSASPQLEALIRQCVRAFVEASSRGYGWRSISGFRFMENCLVELLRLEDSTAYRLAYVCLRQLALVLRNCCLHIAGADGTGGGKKKKSGPNISDKSKAERKEQQQPLQVLIGWPFVRAISLWTRAVGSLPVLRPLAYPLYTIALGAAKHRLTSLQHFPFVYHCIYSLNKLGAQLEMFVPVSSHLLKALGVLVPAMDKAHKAGRKGGEDKTLDSDVKAPDIEVSLRFSTAQASEPLTLETVGNSLCYLFTDHLGLLSQSPAFPEIIAPVMLHLKKHSKHCRSEALRRQLKGLVEKCEASAAAIRARREQLSQAPDPAKFLLFDADTSIAKARVEANRRRAAEEKTRIEAELAQDPEVEQKKRAARRGLDQPEVVVPEGQNAPGEGTSRFAKKRRKAAMAKSRIPAEEAKPAEDEAPAEKRKKRRSALEQARRAGSLPDRDKVEELDFGGDDDDDGD